MFSFSIYASITFGIPQLVYITPVGGVTIMISWVSLMIFGMLAYKKEVF